MPMTITYELENSLYINITNRCSNHCLFCVRNCSDGVISEMNLWLEKEPSVDEVIDHIQEKDVSRYQEFVFCGYGEPMIRAYDILEICRKLKSKYKIPIRINTNGHGNLIYGTDITPQLYGLVDSISISLNAPTKEEYQRICLSDYGDKSFNALLDFADKCKGYIPKVVLSVVDIMPKSDIESCRDIANKIGVEFRIRKLVK